MRTETITFLDPFTDTEISETFYFNLTEPELVELNFEHERGLEAFLQQIIQEEDAQKILETFKQILLLSLGERDGLLHVKSQRFIDHFISHPAYPALYMRMLEEADFAADFIMDCMPRSVRERAAAEEARLKALGTDKPTGPPKTSTKESS